MNTAVCSCLIGSVLAAGLHAQSTGGAFFDIWQKHDEQQLAHCSNYWDTRIGHAIQIVMDLPARTQMALRMQHEIKDRAVLNAVRLELWTDDSTEYECYLMALTTDGPIGYVSYDQYIPTDHGLVPYDYSKINTSEVHYVAAEEIASETARSGTKRIADFSTRDFSSMWDRIEALGVWKVKNYSNSGLCDGRVLLISISTTNRTRFLEGYGVETRSSSGAKALCAIGDAVILSVTNCRTVPFRP